MFNPFMLLLISIHQAYIKVETLVEADDTA